MISRLIVQNYDGHIEFSSTFGEGSTFTFTFKLYLPEDVDNEEAIMNSGKYLDQLPKFDDGTLGLDDEEAEDNYETDSS